MRLVFFRLGLWALIVPVCCLRAAGDLVINPAPVSAWRIDAADGDVVKLSGAGEMLTIDFDVAIDRPRRRGHHASTEGRFLLLLDQPRVLAPEHARILFEARVAALDAKAVTISVRPLMADETGERFSYRPVTADTFKTRDDSAGWQSFRTAPFLMTEAGGAAAAIYDAEGGDQNAWPDGTLRLLGFEVRVNATGATASAPARQAGRLHLAGIRATGLRLADPDILFAYADALFPGPGDYTFSTEILAAFQGRPVHESTITIHYDPDDEHSRRQRVVLSDAGLRNSWIRYRVSPKAAPQVTSAQGSFRHERNIPPQDSPVLPGVDTTRPSVIGRLRINPDSDPQKTGGVYDLTDGATPRDAPGIIFRVFPSSAGDGGGNPLRLRWSLHPHGFEETLASGVTAIPAPLAASPAGTAHADVIVPLSPVEGHDAYRLRYELMDSADTVLESGDYLVGLDRGPVSPLLTRQGNLPDRRDIKSRPYFRTTFVQPSPRDGTQKDALDNFRTMLAESRQLTPHVTYMVYLPDLEVLPSVFDFSLLDRIMDAAADDGCAVTVRIAHAESRVPFRWHRYTRTRDFDGGVIHGQRFYGSYSLTDATWFADWKRAFRALHDRYARHPAFEGYYIMKPGGEWVLPDEPWAGHISDYSWSSAEAFRDYLKGELGLDIPALNRRWGAAYSSWSEVFPPQPDLASGARPDLRPQWTDFSNCKLQWNDSWTLGLSRDIRTYEPDRVVIAYVRLMEESAEKLAGLIDYQHNGGLHGFEAEGMLVDAWEKYKIGWITEPHYPHHWAWNRDGWVLDWSVFVMLSQAGGGGANLHHYYLPALAREMKRYYPHQPVPDASSEVRSRYALAAHYGGAYAYDRVELFKPVLRELHDFKLVTPAPQVAVVHDPATLLTKHRTTFRARLLDLARWFDLLKQDSVDYEYFQSGHASGYKLIVLNPLDEVMSRANLDAIVSAVRNGAWLVTGARTGSRVSEAPGEAWPLLKALGIEPPSVPYSTTVPGVVAQIEPAWCDRFGPVAFFTQQDMRARLADPGIDYLNWPYRWIPQTDYYGIFAGQTGIPDDQVVARFPDGGAALTAHSVGSGRVFVFWGTPDQEALANQGLMATIARLAGVTNPKAGNPIAHMLQGSRPDLNRHYALLWQETPGSYRQKLSAVPDGEWFLDDMLSGERYGLFQGEELRELGIALEFTGRASPLKVLRLMDSRELRGPGWAEKYPRSPLRTSP